MSDAYEGLYASKPLRDGREIVVYPILFDQARLSIRAEGSLFYDDTW